MPENIDPKKAREERLARIRAKAAERAAHGATEDDPETDEEAAARAAAQAARAQSGTAAADPNRAAQGSGRKVAPGPDYSDPEDPTKKQSDYYSGEMAPELAGERAKAERVVSDIKEFINKYSKYAVDRFYGAQAGSVKGIEGSGSDERFGRRGGVMGISQMMDKEKALKLVDNLPMMPQEEIFSSTRTLANYIWKIHGNARRGIRQEVAERLKKQGQLPLRKKEWQGRFVIDPATGEPETTPGQYDYDDPVFKDALEAASKEFDTDSVKVKGAINLLAAAAGTLQRAKGKLGKADATYLAKVPKFMKPPEIVAKQPFTALTPGLAQRVGTPPPPPQKGKVKYDAKGRPINPSTGHANVKPVGPIIRKKNPNEAFERWVNEMVEFAAADYVPTWWDEIL